MSLLSIEPPVLYFPFNHIHEFDIDGNSLLKSPHKLVQTIRIRNTSYDKTRVRCSLHSIATLGIHHPKPTTVDPTIAFTSGNQVEPVEEVSDFRDGGIVTRRDFWLVPFKKGFIYPGQAELVEIEFVPRSWNHVRDTIHIYAPGLDAPLTVELHGYPALLNIEIPPSLQFGVVSLFQKRTKVLTLKNDTPVEFEFEIETTDEHPRNSFIIDPLSGYIPPYSDTTIKVSFLPLALCKSKMELGILTTQFASEKLVCYLGGTGRLLPPVIEKEMDQDYEVRSKRNSRYKKLSLQESEPLRQIQRKGQSNEGSLGTAMSIRPIDLFEQEFRRRQEMERKKGLSRFVCIGEDPPAQNDEHPLFTSLDPALFLTSQPPLMIQGKSVIRIRVPDGMSNNSDKSESPLIPLSTTSTIPAPLKEKTFQERPDIRLSRMFAKAAWKVIYRIRATKRAAILKARGGNDPPVNPLVDSHEHYLDALVALAEKRDPVPLEIVDYRYVPRKVYEVNDVPVMRYARPRPVALLDVSYPDKMGYKPLKSIPEGTLVQVPVKPLLFSEETPVKITSRPGSPTDEKAESRPTSPRNRPGSPKNRPLSPRRLRTRESQVYLAPLPISGPPLHSLFNPLPGEQIMNVPGWDQDELSPEFEFHTDAIYDISNYPELESFETELRASSLTLRSTFYDFDSWNVSVIENGGGPSVFKGVTVQDDI